MNHAEKALQEIFVQICKSYLSNSAACTLYLDYYCQKLDYISVLTGIKEMGFKYYILDNFLTIYTNNMHKYNK